MNQDTWIFEYDPEEKLESEIPPNKQEMKIP